MKHIIIGTAGHVDHGKTTLIQALTGTNPDRLKEEQERGMTIDIGFAALRLPDGTLAGIVDVPGHERFLKNMLAGASGVDVVLLVIAADESVMPQTLEHLDILRLLDVKNGVIALTKCDMVDSEWLETVEEDIRNHLSGSFLENAPIIRVSALKNRGLDTLKKALLSATSRAEARNASLPFRLPIDRVFTRPGFGTVVTGTLVAGTIRVGDSVEIAPQGIATRVRGIQIHGEKAKEALAGMRVAINLAGVELDSLERGAQLAPPHTLQPTTLFDAVIRLLPSAKPFKDRARVRVHIGTAELIGRIRLLDSREVLEPKGRAYVQFRAEEEFACVRGDRFVVRAYSPMQTIGGGTVLDSAPARHRKADQTLLANLESRERGTPDDLIESALQRLPMGLLKKEIPALTSLTPESVETALNTLYSQERVVLLPAERVIHRAQLQSLRDRAETIVSEYHKQFPLRAGIPKEELRTSLGRECEPKPFTSLLNHWQNRGLLMVEGNTIRNCDFQVQLNDRQQALLDRIASYYEECGIATPLLEEVSRAVQAPSDAIVALLRVGTDRGDFAKIAEGIYFAKATLESLQKQVSEMIARDGNITVAALRDATQSNRKFALQALEYLDSIGFTRRNGDERILA
jgi:selenocysteine-specific elongation factor